MNLIRMRDAMSDGGKLTLISTRVEVDNASRARHPEAQLGPYICLAVKIPVAEWIRLRWIDF